MLQNTSGSSYQKGYILNLYQADEDITGYNNSETLPLTVRINTVTNTIEDEVNNRYPFSSDEQKKPSAKAGWLKRLLTGVAVLTSTGALAAGGYYCYTASAGAMGYPERAIPRHLGNSIALAQNSSALQMSDQQRMENSTHITETSPSPYSYYERFYGDAPVEKTLPASASITTSSPEESDGLLVTKQYGDGPGIDNNLIILDKPRYYELANFCLSGVHEIVIKSYKAQQKYKCELLSKIVEKIFFYKNMDSVLREVNSRVGSITVEERSDEIMTRRKLSILYLAAETIINGNNTMKFYDNAMADNKNYTLDEFMRREEKIMNYFSVHNPTHKC